jgi:NCS1 nucleoside transporter family
MEAATAEPIKDIAWSIEATGINPIPDSARHGRPFELFWIWFAANISPLGIVYGVIIVSFGLNFWQSVLCAFLGTALSFLLVGIVSYAGVQAGAPTFALSRAPFGVRGNILPNLVSYIDLLGWEIWLVVIAALSMAALLHRSVGVSTGPALYVVCFFIVAGLIVAVGLLGHATLVKFQTWFTWAFGALTVVLIFLLLPQVDFGKLASLPSGNWLTAFIPALSIIMAGSGLSWANAAADYSRYLPRRSSPREVVWWATFGSTLPLFVLCLVGILLATRSTALASSGDPIGDLAKPLPTWFLIPYLLTAVGGIVAGADLDIYSSGLALLAMGIKVKRYKSIVVDAVVMVVGAIYFLLVNNNFLGNFQLFLLVLGVPLAAWAAVFVTDMALFRREGYSVQELYNTRGGAYYYGGGVNWRALIAFLVGVIVGLGLTTSPVLTVIGWWAQKGSPFNGSSLGIIVGFFVSGLLYAVFSLAAPVRAGAAGSARAVEG